MSYDLMVFDPEAVPKDHAGFMAWYWQQVKWGEAHGYNDPAGCTVRLQKFYADIIRPFPPMNGVFEREEMPDDDGSVTDYSLGTQAIYVSFAWSKAEHAYRIMFDLAAKHGLGFFDASSSEEAVWMPVGEALVLVHEKAASSLWNRLFKRKRQ